MENFAITLNHADEVRHFEVGEYLHHDGGQCKYRIYEDGNYVASFRPDAQNYLHICQNPAGLDEELLDQVADYIESRIPHSRGRLFNDDASENQEEI